MFVLNAKLSSIYASILEIFAVLSIVSLSGFGGGGFMLKKSGLIFKSPVVTVSRTPSTCRFIHYVYGQQRVQAIVTVSCYIMQCHFLSVLIRIHVIHPNATVTSVDEHC